MLVNAWRGKTLDLASVLIQAGSGLFPRDIRFLPSDADDCVPAARRRPGINSLMVRYSVGWREIDQPLRISWRITMKRHEHA
jgi:hypothetical protein